MHAQRALKKHSETGLAGDSLGFTDWVCFAAGGAAAQVMRFGTPDADVMGRSPPGTHSMPRCDSPASSDEGSPHSLPTTSVWPARLPGSGLVSYRSL